MTRPPAQRAFTLIEALAALALVALLSAVLYGALLFRAGGGPVDSAQSLVQALALSARAHAAAHHVSVRLLVSCDSRYPDANGRLLAIAAADPAEPGRWVGVRGAVLLPEGSSVVPVSGARAREGGVWPQERCSRLEGPVRLALDGAETDFFYLQFSPLGTVMGAPQIVLAPAVRDETGPLFYAAGEARGLLFRGTGRAASIERWDDAP